VSDHVHAWYPQRAIGEWPKYCDGCGDVLQPNPGSDEAQQLGCFCAVFDNNHGKYPPFPPTVDYPEEGWWITEGCPLHAPGHSVRVDE